MTDFKNRESGAGGREVEPSIGLAPDYINAWTWLSMAVAEPDFSNFVLKALTNPVLHYAEFVRANYEADRVERVLRESDQAKVEAVNAKVDEFNALIGKFQAEPDKDAALPSYLPLMKAMYNEIDRMIRGDKAVPF